jgi:hypothetical protein
MLKCSNTQIYFHHLVVCIMKEVRKQTTFMFSFKHLLSGFFFGVGLVAVLFVGFDYISAEHDYNSHPENSPIGPEGAFSAVDKVRARQVSYSVNCLGFDFANPTPHPWPSDDACFKDGRVHGAFNGLDTSVSICAGIEAGINSLVTGNGEYGTGTVSLTSPPVRGARIQFIPSALSAADTTWDPTFAYGVITDKTAMLYDPSLRPDDDNDGNPDAGERGSRIFFDADITTNGTAVCHPQLDVAYSCDNGPSNPCQLTIQF